MFRNLIIAGSLALGALLPGAAQAQYWNKPGYGYAPPPPVYYVPPPPRFYAPPVYYAPPPRHYHGRHWHGPHRRW